MEVKEFDATIPHTYDEWNSAGYRPWKGQKMTGRNEHGVATFKPEQVVNVVDFLFASHVNRRINELKKDMSWK